MKKNKKIKQIIAKNDAKIVGYTIGIGLVLSLIIGRNIYNRIENEKKFCSYVCENKVLKINNNTCYCLDGTSYKIQK